MSKRTLEGKVVSTKNSKTLVVNVERKFRHPVLLKVLKDQKNIMLIMKRALMQLGDTVKIIESAPISKLKNGELLEIKHDSSSNRIRSG